MSNKTNAVVKTNPRKAVMIGCGFVGSASVFALMQSGLFSEIVLIDADKDKAEGEAMDISHGIPFARPMKIYAGGYDDVADAAIIVVSAGAGQKPGLPNARRPLRRIAPPAPLDLFSRAAFSQALVGKMLALPSVERLARRHERNRVGRARLGQHNAALFQSPLGRTAPEAPEVVKVHDLDRTRARNACVGKTRFARGISRRLGVRYGCQQRFVGALPVAACDAEIRF